MACNCVTEAQLNEIYKRLGYKKYRGGDLKGWKKIRYHIQEVFMALVLVLIVPMLVVYVAYKSLHGDGRISLTDFFGLKRISLEEYAERQRQQQDIQDKD